MKKRNPQEYIAAAKTEIDLAWRRLPIFHSDRPTALLKLITATDDRMRITALSGTPEGVYFSSALRFSQDALIFGIPWIFSTCRTTNVPIPSIVTEADFAEGNALVEYAEAYDSAVLAFTNYHQGQFDAVVAAKDRRITFVHASPEVELAELQRKAYEIRDLGLVGEGSASFEDRLESMHSLLDLVPRKCIRGSGDRVGLKIDADLIRTLKTVKGGILSGHHAQIDDSQILAGMEYGKVRRYHAALVALCHAHHLLHMSPAVQDIYGGAVSSLAFRMKLDELNAHLAEIGELEPVEATEISNLLCFDGAITNMPSICQPLIQANDTEVLVPYAYALGSRFERNLLKLLARNPKTAKQYDRFSSLKEQIALPKLINLLRARDIFAKDRTRITEKGRPVTDLDIGAYDPRDRLLLAIQHKWLIEPDSVNESKTCDAELARAVEQARVAKVRLADREFARRVIPEIPITGGVSIEAVVISKGFEATGFLSEGDIPIITEEWFVKTLQSSVGLAKLYELAKTRPDRRDLASKWSPVRVSAKLAGYELKIPGFSTRAQRG